MLWTAVYLLQCLESALENGATQGVYLDMGVLYPLFTSVYDIRVLGNVTK